MKHRLASLLLLAEAVLISAYARLVVLFFKPSVRLSYMGDPVGDSFQLPEPDARQVAILYAIKVAMSRCCRYTPWNTECYTQALTVRIMLRRRQIPALLQIGFKNAPGQPLLGHAWTTCGSYIITGYRTDLADFVTNGHFL